MERGSPAEIGLAEVMLQQRVVGVGDPQLVSSPPFGLNQLVQAGERQQHSRMHQAILAIIGRLLLALEDNAPIQIADQEMVGARATLNAAKRRPNRFGLGLGVAAGGGEVQARR